MNYSVKTGKTQAISLNNTKTLVLMCDTSMFQDPINGSITTSTESTKVWGKGDSISQTFFKECVTQYRRGSRKLKARIKTTPLKK
jgi:hypothetical protein